MSNVNLDGVTLQTAEPAAGAAGLPVHQVPIPATPVRIAAAASANVKATPGRVLGLTVNNDSAAIAYVQIIDAAGAGVLGTAVKFEIKVAIGASVTIWFGDVGIAFLAGIAIGSATAAGGAVASAAGVIACLQYK